MSLIKIYFMERILVLVFAFLFGQGLLAQEKQENIFEKSGVTFSGDNSIAREKDQFVELTGNVHFSSSIVEIEKADKIVYDRKTKTFTISGFSELLLNGKKRLASDLGATTLKLEVGDCVAYLIADSSACAGGKGKGC